MFNCIKVTDIELNRPLVSIENLVGYEKLKGLVRLHGKPIGYIQLPVIGDRVSATSLHKAIVEQHSSNIIHQLLHNGLAALPQPNGLCIADLFYVSPPKYSGTLPLVTVAVCTRDRTTDLALCLQGLNCLDYPALDILVVDNAPSSDATKRLVQTAYPNVRYVCEPRPGLDWARNRAIIEARGEIVAYTDDDVVVDPGWVKALSTVFAENPEVMAVTGLVVPYELETEAQFLFEMYGGFGRGFERKWYQVEQDSKMPWRYLGTGQFGTGANMAYRRSLFEQIGYFDPALDVGTVTNGGGDLEMFFRVLKEGHTLVYEPSAIVRHRHRRDYEKLRSQIANNSIGLFSYCIRGALAYPDNRLSFLRLCLWWLWYWNIRRLVISLIHPTRFPRDLILAELKGCFIGLGRYQKAQQVVEQIANSSFLPQPPTLKKNVLKSSIKRQKTVAIRTIDLKQPLHALEDITEYTNVRVFITWNDKPLGKVDFVNAHQPISITHLREAIINRLGFKLLELDRNISMDCIWANTLATLNQHYKPKDEVAVATPASLPINVSVSVVVATYDRPDDLRICLCHLMAQESLRQIEIVVVDNNPASGLTPAVVAEFHHVILVSEPRQGLAYARNAGFITSKGDIFITTDDDVRMPSDWLEKLIVPFARPDVMVVTGNVLPLELETISQRFFETYGGLGRGFEPFEAGSHWFFKSFRRLAVPTWSLGATANAAFRASIFKHPQIGLMDEALGPGMPSGVGEDTYLFYKVLKAGYTLMYEPSAYVWHKHRRDMSALRRQIYNYSKGHVAYHLTTLLRDHDLRSLVRLVIELPVSYMQRLKARLRGRSDYPLSLLLLEIAGNLAGPWSLWQSHQRVKREGHSDACVSISKSVVVQKQLVEAHQSEKIRDLQPMKLILEEGRVRI
ncbi:MAG: glycosyltransferase [Gloeocapsa sp. UFS-A4-WI-NPMV-4B04]|jgi:GT2 family glycosyltransferase|nr:glycosyltransferase [Gloeocapsa sp. UFS-A4-WI-NPMV-4B04]